MNTKLITYGLLSLCMIISGCTAGKRLSYIPDRKSEQCDEVTCSNHQPSHISGWIVPYYIIPLWYESFDNSQENLKIKLYFKIEGSYESLSRRSFLVHDLVSGKNYWPTSIKSTSSIRHEKSMFLMYQAEFDIKTNDLDSFELQFKEEIYSCNIPTVTYKKSEHGFNAAL